MFISRFYWKSVFGLSMLLVMMAVVVLSTQAATFTTTKTADTNDGICNSDCSLREAIAAANAEGSNDVIDFAATLFATAQTLTLTSGTQLEINNNGTLTINGTGADLIKISRI